MNVEFFSKCFCIYRDNLYIYRCIFFSFLIWWITLINFQMLKQSCILEMNFTWSKYIIFLMCFKINLLKFCLDFCHLCFWHGDILACNFFVMSSSGFGIRVTQESLIWTPASSVHGVVDETNKFIQTTEVLWRKRDGMATLWERECLYPRLDRLLLLSNSIHQRRFSFIMLRFASGDYFL